MRLRSVLATFLVLAAIPANAQGEERTDQTIVVTGTPLARTEADLKACLARRCPPKEDIEASLAHAENQFVAGDYKAARHTLAKARGRNARHAAVLPVEVADLTRAYGRMSNVTGFPEVGRILQIDALDALKAGLEESDTRILRQRLMVADEFARAGRLRAAEDIYRKVEREAFAAGRPRVAGFAMLRQAAVFGVVASIAPAYRQAAEQKLQRIDKTSDPALADFRSGAQLLRASLAGARGDMQALDRAVAELSANPPPTPILLYSPPIRLDRFGIHASHTGRDAPQWVDIGFRIATDGTIDEVEMIRDSGNVTGPWADLVRKAIAERRYSPTRTESVRKIERFSFVRDRRRGNTNSRIDGSAEGGRVTSLDLTPAPRQ